jgi:hypothetical protein
VIHVTVPRESATAVPTSIDIPLSEQPTIVRLGSPAPAEPQIVRITSPRPAPPPTVVTPAPTAPVSTAPVSIAPTPTVVAPTSEPPQIIRLASRAEERPQIIRVGSAIPQPPQIVRVGSAISQAPQIVRVGSAIPQTPQIVRLGSTAPSESQVVRVTSQPSRVIRVTSPSTISDGSRIQITNPAQQPATSILQPGGAPSSGGRVVFQPTPPQGVTSPTGTRLSHPTAFEPPFSPQEGTVVSVILPSDSASQHPGRLDDATPVNVVPARHSHSTRSEHSSVASGPIILGPGSIRRVPTVVHAPSSTVGSRASVIELERQAAEAERQRIFQRNEEARRQAAEAAERAEIARQELFEANERERQRHFDDLESERAQLAEDRRHQVFEITESIRREVAERGQAERAAHDQEIGRDIAQAVRDAVDSTNADRSAFMRAMEDERLAAEDERAQLLELRDMERAQELEDHRARMRGLEEELAAAREVLERERLERAAAEQARFDQLRAEAEEREAINRAQLADITNALEERRAEAARWREADDLRWAEKQQRRATKGERAETLHDLVNGIIAEREEERRRQEEERASAAARPGMFIPVSCFTLF